jgi:hypothetical protein
MTVPCAYTRGCARRATNVANDDLPSLEAQSEAWYAYVAARNQADRTLKLEDGRAALAFRKFYQLFTAGDLVDARR